MNTISRTAKLLDRVIRFIRWAILFSIAAIAVFAGVLGFSVARGISLINPNLFYTLTFGNLKLQLAPGVLPEIAKEGLEMVLLAALLGALVSDVIYVLMLRIVQDVLRPFIDREPFHEAVARGLNRLSVLIVINTVIGTLSTGVFDHLTRQTLDIQKLFLGSGLSPDRFVGAVLSNSAIDVTPLFFAGTLYLLSKVFQYGQELQQLSDETL